MSRNIINTIMKRKYLFLGAAILALIVAIVFLVGRKGPENEMKPRIHLVEKGNIINTVTATGTVEPIDQVEVGTQVSGVIQSIFVDYNDKVTKGQLIAQIDESALRASLLQRKASLASAKSELEYQEKTFNRIKMLYEKEMVSESEYDEAKYLYSKAKASVESLESEVEQAQVNLSYARIYSPIDGVVLSKSVEEGQTVAASFSTPTLFVIARDLTRMQVEADVDEADIGQVTEGQRVTFTVDAFPDQVFVGEVTQVRLEAVVESNVVTYTVIIDAPNPDLKLKPGLTAEVTIITKEASDVTVVPAAAFQFSPRENESEEMAIPQSATVDKKKDDMGDTHKRVWLWQHGSLVPAMVVTGIDDGVLYEIREGVLPGDSVVIGMDHSQNNSSADTAKSPFMPSRPGGGRR
ncbi:efflux RND transporter periplasmic adaptor subunit [Thermophagus sp. OGC60D27]|uniref:efflux RND transporter periplasmic adaptor subunit n=1 Tax=Thermophagus sp. OGC60D27 TaxID=3458415 RepID=UPI00403784FB